MLRRTAWFIATATLLAGCGRSPYHDVTLDEPRTASSAQVERYGVATDALVLLELTPDDPRLEIGPTGGFRYRPYEITVDCSGRVQLQEEWEYRKGVRPQSDAVGSQAECGRTVPSGFDRKPPIGDAVFVSVIGADNDDWGLLVVVATDSG